MYQDLFNNISNDYIYPDLAPCSGVADAENSIFEFLPNQQVGVVNGSNILGALNLGNISQFMSSWNQQCKILQPGELFFINGLTHGISFRQQTFPFIKDIENINVDRSLYMSADVSLNYVKNFKLYEDNIFITSIPGKEVNIENAFNIKFGQLGLPINAVYSATGLTFTGQTAGYLFNIGNIDISIWVPDSSIIEENLITDPSTDMPAFKYPNTSMLGYVLTVTYPSIAEDYNSYININHVPDFLEYFTLKYDASLNECYTRHYDAVEVGSRISCTPDVMSAGDYLNYITINNKWEKVGPIRMWLGVQDLANSVEENLITGLYVMNPQQFPVQICYMTIL